MSSKYLTRKEVPNRYPVKFTTLAQLACRGAGPAYAIIGKSAVYRVDDIEAWLEDQVIDPGKGKRGRPRKRGRCRQSPSGANDNEK
ncbi:MULTISPECIES: helix-turn-helix transcriptional regulator [Kiloniella]|uniref:helix-turn-helix transcriptional regulator n=1 Tax=Kiloniella TaxID=454159 RepID=UPI003A93A124